MLLKRDGVRIAGWRFNCGLWTMSDEISEPERHDASCKHRRSAHPKDIIQSMGTGVSFKFSNEHFVL
jgi:hypothetical protein